MRSWLATHAQLPIFEFLVPFTVHYRLCVIVLFFRFVLNWYNWLLFLL